MTAVRSSISLWGIALTSLLTLIIQRVAYIDEDKLTDYGKNLRAELGEKGVRAMKRLSTVRL